jgi:hypothetical protein
LTLPEFLKAFGIYKNIMTQVYPIRLRELDSYQNDIIDMALKFPSLTFYEYHKSFSARAAAMLTNNNIKIDWSVRDTTLFCSVFAGHKANACTVCNSLSHAAPFCPQTNPTDNKRPFISSREQKQTNQAFSDTKGRTRLYHMGREICNNFNLERCVRPECPFWHICSACKSTDHARLACKTVSSTSKPAKPQPKQTKESK